MLLKRRDSLSDRQKERLAIMRAFISDCFCEGIVRDGREDDPPLRLTPNTDSGDGQFKRPGHL